MEVQLFTQMAERAPQISPVLVQKKPEHAFGKVRCRFQGRALEEDAEQHREAVLRLIKLQNGKETLNHKALTQASPAAFKQPQFCIASKTNHLHPHQT